LIFLTWEVDPEIQISCMSKDEKLGNLLF
jgi:hypothetical protein